MIFNLTFSTQLPLSKSYLKELFAFLVISTLFVWNNSHCYFVYHLSDIFQNVSASMVPQKQYSTPSIQIIINKDDMANRSLRLDPSITINERTEDLNKRRVIQLPVRDKRDNLDGEPLFFDEIRMISSTPNPAKQSQDEHKLKEEKQFVDFLSVENPKCSSPIQNMKSEGSIPVALGREEEVTSYSFKDGFELEEPKVRNESFFKPRHFVHIKEKIKKTLDGEYKPDNQAFTDLTEGMSSLRSQVSQLLEYPTVGTNTLSHDQGHMTRTLSHDQGHMTRTLAHDVCSTPMTSSPLNSSIDDLDEFSISPIKETPFDEDILDRARIEHPVQKQLVRRASIAETLAQFESEGRIPPESSGSLQAIMALLGLEVDINDVLEYLEKRIEVNIDRLEKGDNVFNALAGIESDIEFKLLQVDAMRKVTRRDEEELHLAPSQESFTAESAIIGLDIEHLGEISKSPLHFEEDETERNKRYNLMQKIINKHESLLSPRSEHESLLSPKSENFASRSMVHHQISKITIRPAEGSISKSDNSQTVSIPKDQLMMFFQRHLPEQDSRHVMESLGGNILEVSKEEELKTSKWIFYLCKLDLSQVFRWKGALRVWNDSESPSVGGWRWTIKLNMLGFSKCLYVPSFSKDCELFHNTNFVIPFWNN